MGLVVLSTSHISRLFMSIHKNVRREKKTTTPNMIVTYAHRYHTTYLQLSNLFTTHLILSRLFQIDVSLYVARYFVYLGNGNKIEFAHYYYYNFFPYTDSLHMHTISMY